MQYPLKEGAVVYLEFFSYDYIYTDDYVYNFAPIGALKDENLFGEIYNHICEDPSEFQQVVIRSSSNGISYDVVKKDPRYFIDTMREAIRNCYHMDPYGDDFTEYDRSLYLSIYTEYNHKLKVMADKTGCNLNEYYVLGIGTVLHSPKFKISSSHIFSIDDLRASIYDQLPQVRRILNMGTVDDSYGNMLNLIVGYAKNSAGEEFTKYLHYDEAKTLKPGDILSVECEDPVVNMKCSIINNKHIDADDDYSYNCITMKRSMYIKDESNSNAVLEYCFIEENICFCSDGVVTVFR